MGAIERFATAQVAPGERLDFWNRLSAETYPGLAVDADTANFEAEMWRWSLDEVVMLRPRSQASVVRRWEIVQPTASERLIVHLQHRGRMRNRQFGRTAEIGAGDFTILSADAPYIVDVTHDNDALVLELPRAPLDQRLPAIDAKLVEAVSGAGTGSRLLHDFVLSLWQQGDQSGADADWQQGVANVLYDLIALALRGAGPADEIDHGLGARLCRLVEARLCDPELGTAWLARELSLSMRSVQNAFAALATTPSAYILERRLLRAAERLEANPKLAITELAFDLGFNDSAYFTRCFRQRFGASPSSYRRR